MSWVRKTVASTIGAKFIVALTGIVLVGFVIGHMLGNLQIFLGQDALNNYAQMLHNTPALLWGARLVLIVSFFAHIGLTIKLTRQNRLARPQTYAYQQSIQAPASSRTMIFSGLLVLSFVIYHLLHFTLGLTHPEHKSLIDSMGRPDVYSMVVLGFQNIWVSLSYIVAMILLGLHLSHGVSSLWQTLGLNHVKYNTCIKASGPAIALILVAGNLSMPVAVLLGFLSLPVGVV